MAENTYDADAALLRDHTEIVEIEGPAGGRVAVAQWH